jgi:hypothetical protein
MHGEIHNDIYYNLSDEGKIEAVGGFGITADNGTAWLAQLEWGSQDEWLVFEYDEVSSDIILMDC